MRFAALAVALKTGDAYVTGSEELPILERSYWPGKSASSQWQSTAKQLGIPATAEGFVEHLKAMLIEQSAEVDSKLQGDDQLSFNRAGDPVLKKVPAALIPKNADEFAAALDEQMPERTVLDILCNVEHRLNWTRHLGPLSGSEPEI